MIEIGAYNELKPLRNTSVGVFLGDEEGTEVLLPNKYVPRGLDFDGKIKVFCYLDHEERPVATTQSPKIKRDNFALLEVVDVNRYGAFLNWGLEKQLMVPFKEQLVAMQMGEEYLVYCFLDEKSFRLVASSKLDKFLQKENSGFEVNQKVDLISWRKSQLGWQVIINNTHKGLLFFDDVHKNIKSGDSLNGYIKNLRPDGKIDVTLQPLGVKALDSVSNLIIEALEDNNGFLPLHDKSAPEEIKTQLGISKKAFKKGVGVLYKERKIVLTDSGIKLN